MKAVSDSEPLIHLNEITAINCLNFFEKVYIPNEVKGELRDITRFGNRVEAIKLSQKAKDNIPIIANKFQLGIGESEAICLAKELGIKIVLTDDLDAREAAKALALTSRGTLGIIFAAYKKRIISKKQARQFISKLKTDSSLFITRELIDYALNKLRAN